MSENAAIKVYSASAGSGKTYTLVKEYVTLLLKSDNPYKFKNLLAVTFTNKAVAEMKERVLTSLYHFSHFESGDLPPMLDDIAKATALSPELIAVKSRKLLSYILHNYAAFDIVTLDTFTHRLLRTFSKDLELSSSFEVSLDVKELLAIAVDSLIEKAGEDSDITKTLIDFALEKADDDKSWDITLDLYETAQLLVQENDRDAIASIEKHSLEDFEKLKVLLFEKIRLLKAKIKSEALQTLELLTQHNLERSSFYSNLYFDHIVKLSNDFETIDFKSKWKQDVLNHSWYTKTQDDTVKQTIDGLKGQLVQVFDHTRDLYYSIQLHKELLKKVVPLSVLKLVKEQLEQIKEDRNLMLISDFNKHIAKHLKEQPAAFIYERLGERYTNYFIDEFQDTSILQWDNLIPLIDNALSTLSNDGSTNSVMLVGDSKQAIYRWRGGKAEQFISLTEGKHPFHTNGFYKENLPINYRSDLQIVSFNNSFFKYVSSQFENSTYEELYITGNDQNCNSKEKGYVSLSFVDAKNMEEAHELYPPRVLEIIELSLQDGFSFSDICILTRKNDHGSHLAQYLATYDIPVVSSDSLLLAQNPVIGFLESLFRLIAQPDNAENTLPFLQNLSHFVKPESLHAFYHDKVHLPTVELFKSLEAFEIFFSIALFQNVNLYEGAEYALRAFNITSYSDSYVTAFLQLIYTFTQEENAGISGFLESWDIQKEKASLEQASQGKAIQLMSVHKSKGLEFPVVIFPYADSKLTDNRDHHWYPLEPETYAGFEQLMVTQKPDLSNYSEVGAALYEFGKEQQKFDAINVLYVALTRAAQRLYVVSRFRESKKHPLQPQDYSDLFMQFLVHNQKWNDSQTVYEFGESGCIEKPEIAHFSEQLTPFLSTSKESHNLQIVTKASFHWDATRQDAIQYGNLVHTILERIQTKQNVPDVLKEALAEGVLTREGKQKIESLLNTLFTHPQLSSFFNDKNVILTEKALITADGNVHIPDRIEITPDGHCVIFDYKTGVVQESHKRQIQKYSDILTQMGFLVKERLLIYLNEEVSIIAA